MNITIASPNKQARSIEISQAMQKHFVEPINHAQTILNQINSGMYSRWFECKKDLTCIDFGANVGLVSLYMQPACKELYCIEPTPSHFDLLIELLFDTNAMLTQTALTETTEIVSFLANHSTENKVSELGTIKVLGKPLSYYLKQTKNIVDFCKIDIEGGEMKALTTSELKKSKGKVRTFFVEVHPTEKGIDENRIELISRFESNGYKVEVLDYQTLIATYDC